VIMFPSLSDFRK